MAVKQSTILLIFLVATGLACEPESQSRRDSITAQNSNAAGSLPTPGPTATPADEIADPEDSLPVEPALELPAFNSLEELTAANVVETLATGFQFTEGPVWIPDGYLLFSDIPANRIVKWQQGLGAADYRNPSEMANGLAYRPAIGLVACEHQGRGVSVSPLDAAKSVLAADFGGLQFNSPNDCIIDASGAVWFTDPPYGLGGTPSALGYNGVFRVAGDAVSRVAAGTVFNRPNGLALNRAGDHLYIADTADNKIHRFRIDETNELVDRSDFAVATSPDGIKVDKRDHLYVTTAEGVEVFRPDGQRLGVIAFPEQPANCAFGGAAFDELYVTARTSLYRIKLNTVGLP